MTYFHPERMPVVPARRRKAARLQLEELVRRTAKTPKRRPPLIVAAVIAIVLVSSGAAMFAVRSDQPVTNEHTARCFTSASVSGYATEITVAGKPGSLGQVKNAYATCAELYSDGHLKKGVERAFPRPSKVKQPVPHLVVCIWSDGTAAVFPGPGGTCASLDLPAAARR
jgi:hypothetical protein